MTSWITRDVALERLKVKPQTLYAYVSRGQIRMVPDATDARRSRYSAEDVDGVAARKARGKKPAAIAAGSMAWGEPSIATGISTAHHGKLYYRGVDAVALARHATLEESASLLWNVQGAPSFSEGASGCADPFRALAAMVPDSPPILGRSSASLAREAAAIVGNLAQVCDAAPGDAPLHERLAQGWGCAVGAGDRLRQAMVLMADHDLNASTFAARVAASTGASLPACILAGLCTLSGPRHGGAAAALATMVADADRLGASHAITLWLSRDRALPGFGHNLYPEGDPRARSLVQGLSAPPALKLLADAVLDQTGALPNADFAMAVMVEALGLPPAAPFRLFLLGRTIGWCAHVTEQNSLGGLIRPRGRYTGIIAA
jgi:citrate synthase